MCLLIALSAALQISMFTSFYQLPDFVVIVSMETPILSWYYFILSKGGTLLAVLALCNCLKHIIKLSELSAQLFKPVLAHFYKASLGEI